MTIGVFTLEDCPHCEELVGFLTSLPVPFDILPLDDAGNITEMRLNGVFVTEAPVLRIGETWLQPTQLFPGGYLDADQIIGIIAEAGYV